MRLNGLERPRMSGPVRRPHGRGRMHAVLATVLALAACSNMQQADDSARRPSLRVADAALASGAPDVALRVADLTLAKEPRNVRAVITRGDALYAMGQRYEAKAAYRAAIAIDPTAVGGQLGLGRILVRSDPRGAEAAFLAALKYEPDNVNALNNLGIARDLQGRHVEAQEAYYRALTAAPESPDVQVNLGTSLALSGRTDEAVRWLRGVAADPDGARPWRKELADALTLAGDGPWAQQMLPAGGVQPAPDIAPAGGRIEIASALVPSPSLPVAGRNGPIEARADVPRMNRVPPDSAPVSSETTRSVPEAVIAAAPASLGTLEPDAALRIDAAPRIPVAKADLGAIVATAAANPFVEEMPGIAAAARVPSWSPTQARAVATPHGAAVARPAPPMAAPKLQLAVSRPTAPMPVIAADRPSEPGNEAFVQLGSLNSETDAMFEWRRLSNRISELLTGRQPTITRAEVQGRTYWRLRSFGFASIDEARNLCSRVKAAAQRCWPGQESSERRQAGLNDRWGD